MSKDERSPDRTQADKIVYRDLSYKIRGAALAVHNYFGPGFAEKVYENALFYKMCGMGLSCKQQAPLKVYFEDSGKKMVVGEYVADILVEDDVVVEVKAMPAIEKMHYVQIKNYLKATGLRLGLVVNFGTPRLGCERVLNSERRARGTGSSDSMRMAREDRDR